MTKHKITWTISALMTMLLSGVFIIVLIPSLWRNVDQFIRWQHPWMTNMIFRMLISLMTVIISGISSAAAIGSVIIKKGKPSVFMAVSFLMQSVFWFSTISGSAMGYDDFMLTLAFFFLGLAALSLLLMATVCYAGENGGTLTKYRFVPPAVFAVAVALILVFAMFFMIGEAIDDFEYFISEIIRNMFSFLAVILGCVAYLSSMVLAGISLGDKTIELKKAVAEAKEKVTQKKTAAPVKEAPGPEQTKTAVVADDLRKYKQLYDEGVITEEEFAQKEKQIMEL